MSPEMNLNSFDPISEKFLSYESSSITTAVGITAMSRPITAKPTCLPPRRRAPSSSLVRVGRREEKIAPNDAKGITNTAFTVS